MKNVGTGTRILNGMIDYLFILILSIIAFKIWNFYVQFWGFEPYNFGWFYAIILMVYFIFFETIFQRTPGKYLSLSKVVNVQGLPPSWMSILIRTIIRLTIIDGFFIPFLQMPLHDFLSETRVVEI